jgi:hypothetical protein
VRSVVEAIVRPAAELAESGWSGRAFLMILAQLVEEDPESLDPDVQSMLARTGGNEVYALLGHRMGVFTDEVRLERFALITGFILRAVADRARAIDRRDKGGRHQLDRAQFVDNLVAMVAAAVAAPTHPSRPRRATSSR